MCTRASAEQAVDEPRHSAIADAAESQFDHRVLTDRRVDIIIQCVARDVCSRDVQIIHIAARPRSVRVNKKADTPSYVARNLYVDGYALSYVSVRVACICDAVMWLRRRLRAHQRIGSSVGVCPSTHVHVHRHAFARQSEV